MDLILYNPLSKNSKSNIQTHKLIKHYKKNNIPFRLKSILKIDDLKNYLEDKSHINQIILLGGDGTINHFVNNIMDLDISQTIYLKSNGSGNDFLRSLKSNDKAPQTIMEVIYDDTVKTHFINGVGMGVDGLVASYVDNSDKKGKLSYLIQTLRGLINYTPEPATITVDDETYHYNKVFIVTVNNGRYFGGGMEITPQADISTEELDIIIVHSIAKPLLLFIFFTIYLGLHTKFTKYVTYLKGKNVTVEYTSPQISQADGEGTNDVTKMTVQSSNKSVHLKHYDNKKSA
jgi:diacylglycerol kinase family enzyme